MQRNIIFQYLIWQFFDAPKGLLLAWKNFLLFNLNYFSVPLLLKTLFSPWRKYKWSYGKGFDVKRYLEAFFSNMLSRTLGAIVRSFLIIVGLAVEIIIICFGFIVFIGWLTLPIILISGFIFGVRVIL